MQWQQIFSSFLITDQQTLGLDQMIIAILWPFALAFPLVFTYRWIAKNNNYSSSFIFTLFLFPVLAAVVTMLIGNNIARAFGLVGALSIIRFRNALKDPLDAVFIFWGLALGMAAGTGYYLFSVLTTLFCPLLLAVIKWSKIAEPYYRDSILKIIVDRKTNMSTKDIERALGQKVKSFRQVNEYFDSDSDKKTLVFNLRRRQHTHPEDIENSIKNLKGIERVHHLNHQSSLFLETHH